MNRRKETEYIWEYTKQKIQTRINVLKLGGGTTVITHNIGMQILGNYLLFHLIMLQLNEIIIILSICGFTLNKVISPQKINSYN